MVNYPGYLMDNRNYRKLAGSAAIVAFAAVPIAASAAGSGMTAQHFVNEASGTNMLEIKLGKLAQKKSDNPTVDSFAKQMVSDHSSLQDKLSNTAESENLKVPDSLPPKLHKKYQHLAQLSGDRFNKAYARFNIKGHEQAVALFKKEKASDNNAAISKVAGNGLPVIQHHLSMAKHMKQTIMTNS